MERAVYSASKHAVESFAKSMAIEWGRLGIRINAICPTFTRTALTEQTFANPDRVRWITEKTRSSRIDRVGDIMGAVVFRASDASAMVTGTSLGGWRLDSGPGASPVGLGAGNAIGARVEAIRSLKEQCFPTPFPPAICERLIREIDRTRLNRGACLDG